MARSPQHYCHQNQHPYLYNCQLSNRRLFISLITLFLGYYYHQTDAVQHITNDRLGGLDSYKISWRGPPIDKDLEYLNTNDDNVIHISTRDNEKYACIVPGVSHLNFDATATNSSSEVADDQNGNETKSPVQLLMPLLTENICSYKFEVFWVYELCHGQYLRQYHEENAKYKVKITQEYFLGKMRPEQIKAHDEEYQFQSVERAKTGESRPTVLINGHYKPYVMFNMTGGTKCDLTKKNRVSRIIYACNDEPTLDIYSIKEISTCEYEAIVLAPTLCQHDDFKMDVSTQHEIKCYSLEGSPLRPKKVIEYEDDRDESESSPNGMRTGQGKRMSRAYLQGRTLIIDMDTILN